LLTLIHNWLVISAYKFTTFSSYHQKNTRFLYIFDENGIYEDLVLASAKITPTFRLSTHCVENVFRFSSAMRSIY